VRLAFTLDGSAVELEVPADASLAGTLRDALGLTATKLGCGVGRCGACAVLLDGVAVNACVVPAWRCAGRAVTTAAGLDALPETAAAREALAEHASFQCGYCAPGVTVALVALLRSGCPADEDSLRAGLEGHLCRCTGYHSILRGALAAAARLGAAG
jgi:aerobic-type carbon monoxide dehydrogenase small subunit (CoxS/CutS family)